MKILILEDNPERHKAFRHNLVGAVLKIVTTVEECIHALKTDMWDALFLDHDLGGEAFVDPSEKETGYHVAKWLEDNPDRKPSTIIIHSLNYSGAARMKMCLPDAVVSPGAWTSVTLGDQQ
jgi:CheY-like chemotaxis protein